MAAGINNRSDGAWEMDTAAFLPEPEGYIKIDGESYPIYSFLDLPVEESMKVVRLGDEIESTKDLGERLGKSVEHLLALNAGPDHGREGRKLLTRERLMALTSRQIVGLIVLANSIAAVPQKAGESQQSESASSAPAPAVSTGGHTAS